MRSERLGLLVVIALLFGACGADPAPGATSDARESASDLEGYWHLRWIDVSGITSMVAVDRNTSGQPWIHFTSTIEGSLGCNSIQGMESGIDVQGDHIFLPDGFITTAALCPDREGHSEMQLERALQALLGSGSTNRSGIEFSVDEGTLTLVGGAYTALFDRADSPPTYDRPPAPSSFYSLDCAPGVIEESRFVGDDLDPIDLLVEAAPEVVSHSGSRPFWFGIDADGLVVAAVAEGDIRPVQWQVFTCVDREPRPAVVPVLRVEAVAAEVGDLGWIEFLSDGSYRGEWLEGDDWPLAPIGGSFDVAVLGPLASPMTLEEFIEFGDSLSEDGRCPHLADGVSWYLYFYDDDGVPRIISCRHRFDAGDDRFTSVVAAVGQSGIDEAHVQALSEQLQG